MRQLRQPTQPHRPAQPQVQAHRHHTGAENYQAHLPGPAQAVTAAAGLHHRDLQQRRLEQQLRTGVTQSVSGCCCQVLRVSGTMPDGLFLFLLVFLYRECRVCSMSCTGVLSVTLMPSGACCTSCCSTQTVYDGSDWSSDCIMVPASTRLQYLPGNSIYQAIVSTR